MNNEWITDRRPHRDEGPYVYRGDGAVRYYTEIPRGEIWRPIPKCEPYVKPKRYEVRWTQDFNCWMVQHSERIMGYSVLRVLNKKTDAYRKAAQRIAAIYEEMMP